MYKSEMIQALHHEKARHFIPIWELEFHIWQKFSKRPYHVGESFVKLTSAEKEAAVRTNAEIMAEVSEELHFSGLTIPSSYWEVAQGTPCHYWLPDCYRLKQAEALRDLLDKRLLLVANTGGVMGMPSADRYLEFSYKLFDEPKQVDQLAADCLKKGLERMRQFADIGIQCVLTASDMADNKNVFFSPDQMARHIYPFLSHYMAEAKKLGLFAIMHTDGMILDIIDGLLANGATALQGIDPVSGMDIRALQEKYSGVLTVCGNLDCGLFITEAPEIVYNQTADLIDKCKSGGSFVLGLSNAVQAEVSRENYLAMIEAWKYHGWREIEK